MPFIELAYGVYMTICIILSLRQGNVFTFSLPFLIIFAVGYYYVAILTLYGAHASKNPRLKMAVTASNEEDTKQILKSSAI